MMSPSVPADNLRGEYAGKFRHTVVNLELEAASCKARTGSFLCRVRQIRLECDILCRLNVEFQAKSFDHLQNRSEFGVPIR
jgi:hypothetical protein